MIARNLSFLLIIYVQYISFILILNIKILLDSYFSTILQFDFISYVVDLLYK